MKRLSIKQGERTVRHDIGEGPIVIGRDEGCDLTFEDHRLSRRHARFELKEAGLHFIDLGSRNGSWLDSKKVNQAWLKPGDTIRLGELIITYEEEQDAPVAATVILKRPEAAKPEPSSAVGATVMLPVTPKPSSVVGATVMLPAKPEPSSVMGATVMLPSSKEPAAPRPLQPPMAEAPPPPEEKDEAGAVASWSWSLKFLTLVSALGLLVYMVLAFPLLRTMGSALQEESLRRGRTLLELLAATNSERVGEGQLRELSVDVVIRKERVKEALLLDREGQVLAPPDRADESLAEIEGIEVAIDDIRTFYLGRRRGGDYVMVQPILHQGRLVGVAVLVYEVASASASLATAVLFIGLLVLLVGVVVAAAIGKRMTLVPIGSFRDDVEAVVKRDASRVPPRQGFSELSELAKSVNRLIDRARSLPPEKSRPPVPVPPPKAPALPVSPVRPPADIETPSVAPPPRAPVEARAQEAQGAKLWADENFIVIRVEQEVAALIGSTPEKMIGKHLIEAISEQRLLEVVLDTINNLEDGPGASKQADLPTGSVEVSAAREGESVIVSIREL